MHRDKIRNTHCNGVIIMYNLYSLYILPVEKYI